MASTPICRCRVLYLGSAVPHITKDGLHGIQEPLRELYPEEGVYGAKGIDSWLSVWSNGLLLENVDEKHKRVTRFFPIESLHYCAAVRHVSIPGPDGEPVERFLPLDSPFARMPSVNNPPLFACILRRVAGIKVLECHAFVCKKEMAANALVRCCFHAYADNTYAKHLETGGSIYGSLGGPEGGGLKMITAGPAPQTNGTNGTNGALTVNPIQKVEQWRAYVPTSAPNGAHERGGRYDPQDDSDHGELVSIYDGGNENHKVWAGEDQQSIYADYMSTIRSVKSMTGSGTQRSNRPRQLTAPSSPPPPPPPITTVATIETQNGRKKESKPKERNGRIPMNGHNGGRYPPMSASEFRPVWPPRMRPLPPHGYPMAMLPPHLMGPRLPPGLIPVPPPQVPHRPKSSKGGPMPRSMEEPIYLPSGRAMSPVASYKPGAFPYEQYYLNQHGGQHPHPPQPHYANGPVPPPPGKTTKYKKKKDKDNSDSDSKYNTGIYRKKGHLNERAFSYSIRQEHRSRSHSSLATLSFADPAGAPANGNGSATPTNGALNGHGTPKTNGHHVTNGNSGEHPHPRTNGKMNGSQGSTSGSNGRPKKKGGKNGVVHAQHE